MTTDRAKDKAKIQGYRIGRPELESHKMTAFVLVRLMTAGALLAAAAGRRSPRRRSRGNTGSSRPRPMPAFC